jgi:hypothetical protein
VGKEQGEILVRPAHVESRVRVSFETDAVDDFFTRKIDRGTKSFAQILGGEAVPLQNFVGPNVVSGKANVIFDLPEGTKPGDILEVHFNVQDPVTQAEFENVAHFTMLAAVEQQDSRAKKPRKKTDPNQPPGPESDGNAGLAFPEVHWVKPGTPNWISHFGSLDDCLSILDDGDTVDGKHEPELKFYLNEGNKALAAELASSKLPVAAVKKQFEIGVVLIGMALIHDAKRHGTKQHMGTDEDQDDDAVYRKAGEFTRAISPVILPIIQSLGDLTEEEVDLSDLAGQAA